MLFAVSFVPPMFPYIALYSECLNKGVLCTAFAMSYSVLNDLAEAMKAGRKKNEQGSTMLHRFCPVKMQNLMTLGLRRLF